MECRLSSLLVITRSGEDADAVVVAMLRKYELEVRREAGAGEGKQEMLLGSKRLYVPSLSPGMLSERRESGGSTGNRRKRERRLLADIDIMFPELATAMGADPANPPVGR